MQAIQGDIKNFFDNVLRHRLPFEDLKQIWKALERVPVVELKYSMVKCSSTEEVLEGEPLEEGGEALVTVNLRRTNRSNRQFVTAANFPKPKECSWFLLVGNKATNELLAMKRLAFKRYSSKNLAIQLPAEFRGTELQIVLMCDSYIGMDQEYSIDLEQINGAIRDQAEPTEATESLLWADPEAEPQTQPQGEAEQRYESLFSSGYEQFSALQGQAVTDVLSDDEGDKPRQSNLAPVEEEPGQIPGSQPKQQEFHVSRIEMLLDSDSDVQPQEDGMIEKDMDNFF